MPTRRCARHQSWEKEGSISPRLRDWRNCDAFLSFRIVPVRQARINTVFVDSLDVDDLGTTVAGDLRYLWDQVFYVAWIEATAPRAPFVASLNAIVVLRAQFLNSSANHTLRSTTDASTLRDHLKTLTFTAFDESAGETTNAIAGLSQFQIMSCTAATSAPEDPFIRLHKEESAPPVASRT